MEVDIVKSKRTRYGKNSVKSKGEMKIPYRVDLQKKKTTHINIYQVNMHTWDTKKRIQKK
jgi:hypothetical protein